MPTFGLMEGKMKRNQKGEVVIATVIVLLTAAFVGLIAANGGKTKTAEAEQTTIVAEAK